MAHIGVAELAEQYSYQLSIYKEIHNLAGEQEILCRQSDFNGSEEVEKLNKLLALRQGHMDKIDENQEIVAGIKQNLQDELGLEEVSNQSLADSNNVSPDDLYTLKEKLDQLQPLLARIAELDKKSQTQLQDKINNTKKEIKNTQSGQKALNAYHPKEKQRQGIFLDKKEKR